MNAELTFVSQALWVVIQYAIFFGLVFIAPPLLFAAFMQRLERRGARLEVKGSTACPSRRRMGAPRTISLARTGPIEPGNRKAPPLSTIRRNFERNAASFREQLPARPMGFKAFVAQWANRNRFLADAIYTLAYYAQWLHTLAAGMAATVRKLRAETIYPYRSLSCGTTMKTAVTNVCNAKCVFCAYPRAVQNRKLKLGVMPFEIFKKAVDEWAALGGENLDLTPTVGDTLVDPGLLQKIQYAVHVAKIRNVVLTTNGILLDKNRLYRSLIDSGLRCIYISTQGTDRAMYKSIYGVDCYEEVISGLTNLLEYNRVNVLSTATNESASLGGTFEQGYFDERNTFYWGPRQYENLPSAIRNSLTNETSPTFNAATLTTNDFKLGWTRHWLRRHSDDPGKVFLGETISVERAPSPAADGSVEGLLTWYDYPDKTPTQEHYEGYKRLPSIKAWREPGGAWHTNIYVRNRRGKPTMIQESFTDAGGAVQLREWRYTYADNRIDLTSVSLFLPQGAVNKLISSNVFNALHQITTHYNALGEATTYSYADETNTLLSISYPNGLVADFSYDSNGFLTNVVDRSSDYSTYFRTNSYTYTNGYVRTVTDERGLTITNVWDALGRLLKRIYPDGTGMTNVYDKFDLVVNYDRMGFTNGWAYNGFRQVIRATNANHKVTTYDYCDCGSLDSITDATATNTTSFLYDNLGRRTRTMHPGGSWVSNSFNLFSQVVRVTDSAGVNVTNFYTFNGLLQASSNAFGCVVFNRYDSEDQLVWALDANGVAMGYGYDAQGRLTARTNFLSGSEYPGDDFGASWELFSYSAGVSAPTQHEALRASGENPPVTIFAYDGLQRKTNEVRYMLGGGTPLETNTFAYSPSGALTKLTDGKFQATTWKYDQYGRVTNKTDHAGNVLFVYKYDANDRLTNRWSAARTNTFYSYDAVGNLTKIDYPTNLDVTLSYDANNRLISMVDAVGTTTYGYTAFGALGSEDGPWPADTVNYSYTTNRLRQNLSLLQPNASAWLQTYAYDAVGRLTNIVSPAGAFGYQYHPGLDPLGVVSPTELRTKLTLPNGAYVANTYDTVARLTGTYLKTSGNVVTNAHEYGYNGLYQRTRQTRVKGDYVDYGYDDLGQLKTAIGKESGGQTNRLHEQFGYAYDAAGNLNYRTNNALVQTFSVNNLNELTSVARTTNQTVAGATWGPATSVTVNTVAATRYADNTFVKANIALVNGNNTLTAVAQDSAGRSDTHAVTVNLPTSVSMAWDKNGNLCTNGTRILDWDDENQLIRITEPNAWKSEFVYDGKMRRRVRVEFSWVAGAWVTNQIVRYVYDGNLVIQERDQFNVPKVAYTRGLDMSGSFEGAGGIGGLLAFSQLSTLNPQHFCYHADGNGNVTCLIASNQLVVARYIYDPFGNTLSASGPVAGANLYRFSSKELHAESGLVYYLYRFYEPGLQRWPNRDPIGDVASLVHVIPFIGPPGSEDNHAWELQIAEVSNLSLFVLNDPVNWIDLNGEAGIRFPKLKPKPKPKPKPTTPPNANASCFNPKCPVGSKKNPINVPPGTNPPGKIGGRDYSGHSLDRMQGRGIYPSAVENAIKNGKSCPASLKGRTRHYDADNDMTVYTDDATGRVITVLFGEGGL